MVDDMRKNGVFTVKYKNGAQVPLEAYAAMAARTARAETQNIGSIGWAEEHGIDYVQMSTVFPTCPVCARFQGRVYCISGKDKRFMPLFGENSPLSSGYALVHPNCRHLQRLFAANNINFPYTSLGGFRRAKRTNSSAYKDSRRIFQDGF